MKMTGYNLFMQNALKYGFFPYGLRKTGQITEYRAGDDGTYKKGYPLTGDRFVDSGNGTIYDKITGLYWVKDGNGPGCNNGAVISWADGIDLANNLDFGGFKDWRMPNILELYTLYDYGRAGVNKHLEPFRSANAKNGHYWTSTSEASSPTRAWIVDFSEGGYVFGNKNTESKYMRSVRGG